MYKSTQIKGLCDLDNSATSAEKLFEQLDKRNDKHYSYLTYKLSKGLVMMTDKHIFFINLILISNVNIYVVC